MSLQGAPLWVTFDAPQSRSLLAGEDVRYVRFTAPRDFTNVTRNLPTARQILSEHHVVEVVSTGSAVALSFLPLARATGVPVHYIESAARSDGPSLTGRILERIPGVRLYTQYASWANERWKLAGSVFDEFEIDKRPRSVDEGNVSIVVTLGTLDFRFDRLVKAVRDVIRPGWTVTWQTGNNTYGDLPGTVKPFVGTSEFQALCASADVVISHA
ncbi:MAG: hypothetical protein JHD16_13930, partial [Solirubrobacteraceae bacterium]|nr:hypothetical protein [Solirubrobacteraceae bacterium]